MTQMKPVTTIVAVTLAVSLLSACGYGRSGVNQAAPRAPINQAQTIPSQIAGFPTPAADHNRQVAERIVSVAKKIDGVTKATAVVNRNDAVVGIDVKQGSNMKQVEKKVHSAVKSAEPNVNVHVTSDRNLHGRIQTLHTQVHSNPQVGHPVRDVGADITLLIRDIGRSVTAPFR